MLIIDIIGMAQSQQKVLGKAKDKTAELEWKSHYYLIMAKSKCKFKDH